MRHCYLSGVVRSVTNTVTDGAGCAAGESHQARNASDARGTHTRHGARDSESCDRPTGDARAAEALVQVAPPVALDVAVRRLSCCRFGATRGDRVANARRCVLVDDDLVERELAVSGEDQERIADELHDGIAHDLTLVLFHARALPKQPDAAGREVSLATIEESSTRALHTVHTLLALMRDPSASSEQPPDENVTDTVVGLGRLLNNAGIPTVVRTPTTDTEVPGLPQRLLGAAAIEAVTNVIKHAPHSSDAAIEVTVDELGVKLVVENSNSRASSAQGSSLGGRGLARARQRLEQHNGHLEAGATNNSWIVRADLPLHPPRGSRPVTS